MTISNTSAISALINGVMNEATSSGNRSAALVVEMFNSELTFSKAAILNVMRKQGAERTAAIDTVISLVSDDFKRIHAQYDVATHKDHKAKLTTDRAREANAFEAGALLGKIKAARIMVTRAMSAVFYLRERECSKLSIKKFGAQSSLVANITDDEGDAIKVTKSVAELIREGDKAVANATGKVKAAAPATAKNPVAHALADSSKALAAALTGINAKETKPLTDFSDDVEAQMETTLAQLFKMKFFDGNKFDNVSFKEWMASQFKQEAKPVAPAANKKAA